MEFNYCPKCGDRLNEIAIEGYIRPYCKECDHPVYQNPKPNAGVLILNESNQVLLIKRSNPPAIGSWSLPAGYLEADESPEKAAVRELEEETGIEIKSSKIKLFDTSFVEHPDGHHVIVIIYLAQLSRKVDPSPGTDAEAARFWTLSEISERKNSIEPGYADIFQQAILDEKSTE